MEELEKLGFKKNHKIINGFRPHYTRGKKDVLFLIGKDFWGGKITNIEWAFKFSHNVFGALTNDAPGCAAGDFIVRKFTCVKLNPLRKARWSDDRRGISFDPVESI